MKIFVINKLMRPYEEGGTPNSPVRRSLETIATKLLVSHKLPPRAVGAAIFQVFYAMANEGLVFRGDGTYGSRGKELFSQIKAQAISIVQREAAEAVAQEIMDMTACTIADCPKRCKELIAKSRWQRAARFLMRPRGLWRL
jgi:hypothetical protein